MNYRFGSLIILTGCFSKWSPVDIDGDGLTPIDGDCWDSSEPPPQIEGALPHTLGPEDVYIDAVDIPYDGIDANCDGQDDFDVDGDGYVPSEYFGIQTLGLSASGQGLDGDCWDDPATELSILNGFSELLPNEVNAGAIERWYDGVDQDCNGLSDFDQDVDNQDSSEFDGIDCNDLDPAIFEGANEVFYDGIDQDCLGGDDCDADGDGYPSSEDGLVSEVCPEVVDCDDNNSDIFPDESIIEIAFNGIDDDCNGQTGDGDSDGDGHWAEDYIEIMFNLGLEPLDDVSGLEKDCWDDTESIPMDFVALNSFPQLTSEMVYPLSEAEISYDGIDAACDGPLGEFDGDGDGFDTRYYSQRSGDIGDDCVDSFLDIYDGFDPNMGVSPDEIFPGAMDVWYDGIDADCFGNSDYDADEDMEDSSSVIQPSGAVGLDCDDNNPLINTSAIEVPVTGFDENCDGLEMCYTDADQDSFGVGVLVESTIVDCNGSGVSISFDDCNDNNGTIFPSATEIEADGQDSNCDGQELCYLDADLDTFGGSSLGLSSNLNCNDSGFSGNSNDCNDGNYDINPLGVEVPLSGIDENCDGLELCYSDADEDGYGISMTILSSDLNCLAVGVSDNADDCDGSLTDISPAALEVCDGVDNDCDSLIDDDDNSVDVSTGQAYYFDFDEDGYGDPNSINMSCLVTDGYVANFTDCNDLQSNINPAAQEVCDGDDNDCDTLIDDDDSSVDASNGQTYYLDSDADTYGDPNFPQLLCQIQPGYSSNFADCDDLEGNINPAVQEVCDGDDNDCDTLIDDDDPSVDVINSGTLFYSDSDGDGFGDPNATILSCDVLANYVDNDSDCDDLDEFVNPLSQEFCNGYDDNCVDGIDEDTSIDAQTWYFDDDFDGYGAPNTALAVCEAPSGYLALGGDCDDTDSDINPAAIEICDNGVDEDCVPGNCAFVTGDIVDQLSYTMVEGTHGNSIFAESIAASDFDGDGNMDAIAIGECRYNNSHDGRVYITDDPLGLTNLNSTSSREEWYVASGKRNGKTVDIRDIDGDGDIEVVGGTNNRDFAYIISMSQSNISNGGQRTGYLSRIDASDGALKSNPASVVKFVGDQDGDSVDDLWVGAINYEAISQEGGGVFLISGADLLGNDQVIGENSSDDQMALFYSNYTGDLGRFIDVGDINGDGIDDTILGETVNDCAYVLYGGLGLIQGSPNIGEELADCNSYGSSEFGSLAESGDISVIKSTTQLKRQFGVALSIGGDLTGDGLNDFVVTDRNSSATNSGNELLGRAYVFEGDTHSFLYSDGDAYTTLVGAFDNTRLGIGVDIVPDLDGDGDADLALGSYYNSAEDGAVHLYYGLTAGLYTSDEADVILYGSNREAIGAQIVGLGDIDGNGLNDLMFSGFDNYSTNPARLYFFPNIAD